jgi:hypothetical protein
MYVTCKFSGFHGTRFSNDVCSDVSEEVLTAVIQLGAETSKSTKLIHSGIRTQKTIHVCHVLRSSFGDTCLHMFNTIFTVHQSPNFPLRTFDYSSLSFLLKLRLCEWFSDPHKQERSRTSTEHNLLSTEMTQRTLFLPCLSTCSLSLLIVVTVQNAKIDITASGRLREHVIQDLAIVENSTGVEEGKLMELHFGCEEHWYSVTVVCKIAMGITLPTWRLSFHIGLPNSLLFMLEIIWILKVIVWANPSDPAVEIVGLLSFACWDCGFESRRPADVCLLWVLCLVR